MERAERDRRLAAIRAGLDKAEADPARYDLASVTAYFDRLEDEAEKPSNERHADTNRI